jgi:hypothetical protein
MSSVGTYDDGNDIGGWGSDDMEMQISSTSNLDIDLTQDTLRPTSRERNYKRIIIDTLICNQHSSSS